MSVELGFYKHFKGKVYRVIGVGKHSETGEEMVVYKALYDGPHGYGAIWIRPAPMFLEVIERDGQTMRRFAPMSDTEALELFRETYEGK